MKVPKLKIGSITAKIPIIQGGMGVRVSLSSLAAAVADAGGIGTIASVGLGNVEEGKKDFVTECRESLVKEIQKAKSLTKGALAVNFMGVLSNANDMIRAAVKEGIQIIIYGAGLPLKLPETVGDSSVNLVPIVSSARVARLILQSWDKRYGRIPDALILEGPLAGGHLGFSLEQLQEPEKYSLDILLSEILETIKPFEDKYGMKIPVITAGGIFTGKDIAKMLSLGAAGVQMATRFVATEECDVSQEFKQAYIDAKEEDIAIIKSPVGMPGRALKNKFLDDIENGGKQKIKCPYRCLTLCKVGESKYCIALALLNSYFGNVDRGLIFCGQNAHRVHEIVKVKDLMSGLVSELQGV